MKHLILIILSLGFIDTIIAQDQFNDTIYFMNGAILECNIVNDNQIAVDYEFLKKKKVKTASIHKSEIFGIVKDGIKSIYYAQNQIVGDELSISQVEVFLAGERDARNNYSTKKVFYSGLAITLATSILGEAALLAVSVPLVAFPLAQYIPIIRIREKTITNPDHRFNALYSEGYEGVARKKRFMSALKGSAIGTIAGATFFRLVLR